MEITLVEDNSKRRKQSYGISPEIFDRIVSIRDRCVPNKWSNHPRTVVRPFGPIPTACGILTSLNDRPMSIPEPSRKEMHRGEVLYDALLGPAAVVYSIGFGRRAPLLRLSAVKMAKSPWEISFRPLGPVNPCFPLVGRKFSPPHWSRELPCPQRSRALVPRSYL